MYMISFKLRCLLGLKPNPYRQLVRGGLNFYNLLEKLQPALKNNPTII
jgi:hypothetical protein